MLRRIVAFELNLLKCLVLMNMGKVVLVCCVSLNLIILLAVDVYGNVDFHLNSAVK